MELYFVRHGQAGINDESPVKRVEDAPLTPLGRRQAELVAEWLAPLGLTRLICSPFRRALETCDRIRAATGLKPEVWTDLHEQGGCIVEVDGSYYEGRPGMTRSDIAAEFPDFILPDDIDERGWWRGRPAESFAESQERALRVARRIGARLAGPRERAALIFHGTFIKVLTGSILQLPVTEEKWWLGEVFNTAVAKLIDRSTTYQLDRYNSPCHLPGDMVT